MAKFRQGDLIISDTQKIDFNEGTVSGTGNMVTGDHGTATKPEVVNAVYGTGDAPAANTTTEGALYFKYTA